MHYCMGAPPARVEMRVAVEALIDRLPNPRLVPGHRIRRQLSIAIPSVLEGVVAEWDVR